MSRASATRHLREAAQTTVARSSGWLLASASLGRVAGVVSTLALSRMLIPREFGRLALMQYLITFLAGFAGGGLGLAARRQVAATRTTDQIVAGRYVGLTVSLTTVGGLLVLAICVAAPHPVAEILGQDGRLSDLVPLTALGAALTAVYLAALSALVGLEQFALMARVQIIQAVLVAGTTVAGAGLHGITGALLGLAVGQALATGWTIQLLHRGARAANVTIRYQPSREEAARLGRIGGPAFIAFLAASLSLLFGQTRLSHSPHGYANLAAFNVAYRWHLGLLFLPTSALPMFLPMMSRMHSERRSVAVRTAFRRTVWATAAIVAVPAVVVIALSEPLLALSGSFYAHHQETLIILALAAVPAALNNVLSSAGVGLNLIRAWLVSDVILAATLVIVTVLLVTRHGPVGLALAYLAAYVATDLAMVRPLRRALPVPSEAVA